MGGGILGNTEGAGDNQSSSESKTEREEGSVCKLVGKTGACGDIFVETLESSSNVTHCLFCLLVVGGCGWREGIRGGGSEEAGARGKAGASGVGSRGNNGAVVGFCGGPNREADFCKCGGTGAGVGTRGWVSADIVL